MIKINNLEDFDIESILTCGQIFRFNKLNCKNGVKYGVFSKDKYAQITQTNSVVINSTDDEYFYNFFDLGKDYASIKNQLIEKDEKIRKYIDFGKGIRILNQDFFETTISFVVSQNNNIQRIKRIINDLCATKGDKHEFGFAFPTLSQLSTVDTTLLNAIGCGYRTPYILNTLSAFNKELLAEINNMSNIQARNTLTSIKGIGNKVADCIMLFGLHRLDSCPIDTWMRKAYKTYFNQECSSINKINERFSQLFGEYAGIAQQYIFHYTRVAKV